MRAWQIAEFIDKGPLVLKLNLLECIAPDESSVRATEDIKPESTLAYFGRERCLEFHLRSLNDDDDDGVEEYDIGIKIRVAGLFNFILEQNPQRLSSILNFQSFVQGQMARNDPIRPILEKLYPTPPDQIEKLPDDMDDQINVDEARLLYERLKSELIMPGSETRRGERGLVETIATTFDTGPEGPLNPQNPLRLSALMPFMEPIDQLLKERFAFGRVSYQLH
jgi:hypothetical protein